ncbi:hypothetical protein [Hyphomicrobium sp.]|uniref:tetratricopeptide repeat protein n=1 Tax=Hyphomicrobium sp. TaxID=82 RepID=UPI000FC3A2D1|nr:hypothetical protein [Hyphomicrobium sp.]RUP09849.1 MAG: hypothetical protein EKK38_05205 [Hyphomicrobium sp.]
MSVGVENERKSEAPLSNLSRRSLTVLLTALALVLGALVFFRTFVACIERIDPETAIAIRASDANAELDIASNRLASIANAEGSIRDQNLQASEELRQRLLRALYVEPLSAQAFELLGMLSVAGGDTISAKKYMQAAAARSPRSPAALYWLLRYSLSANDIEDVIDRADALLRIRPDLISGVTPALGQIAGTPAGLERLIATLSKGPPWRKKFFLALNGKTKSVDTPKKLLVGLVYSDHPPTPNEIGTYLRYLINSKYYERAYSAWLEFLSPTQLEDARLLFNGGFRFRPSGLPFDWTIEKSHGALTEIVAAQGETDMNALSIEFGGGRVDFHPVSQVLVLAPGRYRLHGISKGSLKGLRGLKWQLACIEQPSRALAESKAFLEESSDWTDFSLSFEIPASCRAEIIRLILDARSASETLVTGSIAFARLRILRDDK